MEVLLSLVVKIFGGRKLDKVACERSCGGFDFLSVCSKSMLVIEVVVDDAKAGGCKKTAVVPSRNMTITAKPVASLVSFWIEVDQIRSKLPHVGHATST